MKRFLRKCTALIILTIFSGNIAFGDTTSLSRLDHLAPPSLFNYLAGIEHKDIGRIKVALESFLSQTLKSYDYDELTGLSFESLQSLLSPTYTDREQTIFEPAHMQFFFSETRELPRHHYSVMCRIVDNKARQDLRTYHAVFSILEKDQGYPIEIFTEEEYNYTRIRRHMEATGEIPVRGNRDGEEIDRYIRENELAIDPWIRKQLAAGNFVEFEGRAHHLGWDLLYPDRIRPQQYWSDIMLRNTIVSLWHFLNIFGIDPEKALAGKNMVFIRIPEGESAPVVEIDGNKMLAKSHASEHALYFFLDHKVFDALHMPVITSSLDLNALELSKKIQRFNHVVSPLIIHEIGALYGLPFKIDETGHITNDLDTAFRTYRELRGNDRGVIPGQVVEAIRKAYDPLIFSLKTLSVKNLDTSLLGRDYLIANVSDSHSAFEEQIERLWAETGLGDTPFNNPKALLNREAQERLTEIIRVDKQRFNQRATVADETLFKIYFARLFAMKNTGGPQDVLHLIESARECGYIASLDNNPLLKKQFFTLYLLATYLDEGLDQRLRELKERHPDSVDLFVYCIHAFLGSDEPRTENTLLDVTEMNELFHQTLTYLIYYEEACSNIGNHERALQTILNSIALNEHYYRGTHTRRLSEGEYGRMKSLWNQARDRIAAALRDSETASAPGLKTPSTKSVEETISRHWTKAGLNHNPFGFPMVTAGQPTVIVRVNVKRLTDERHMDSLAAIVRADEDRKANGIPVSPETMFKILYARLFYLTDQDGQEEVDAFFESLKDDPQEMKRYCDPENDPVLARNTAILFLVTKLLGPAFREECPEDGGFIGYYARHFYGDTNYILRLFPTDTAQMVFSTIIGERAFSVSQDLSFLAQRESPPSQSGRARIFYVRALRIVNNIIYYSKARTEWLTRTKGADPAFRRIILATEQGVERLETERDVILTNLAYCTAPLTQWPAGASAQTRLEPNIFSEKINELWERAEGEQIIDVPYYTSTQTTLDAVLRVAAACTDTTLLSLDVQYKILYASLFREDKLDEVIAFVRKLAPAMLRGELREESLDGKFLALYFLAHIMDSRTRSLLFRDKRASNEPCSRVLGKQLLGSAYGAAIKPPEQLLSLFEHLIKRLREKQDKLDPDTDPEHREYTDTIHLLLEVRSEVDWLWKQEHERDRAETAEHAWKVLALDVGFTAIPTHADTRYTLVVDNNLYKDDDYSEDVLGHRLSDEIHIGARDRFNLVTADTGNIDALIEKVTDPERTIVQISGHIGKEDIRKLMVAKPGVRYLYLDTMCFKYDHTLNDKLRRQCRFNIYAMMLLARSITHDDVEANSNLYKLLSLYLNSHYHSGLEEISPSYINALIAGTKPEVILKYALSYVPAKPWRITDYNLIAITLISA